MSADRWPADLEIEGLSRMARESSDFYKALATTLSALGRRAPEIYGFALDGATVQFLGQAFFPSDDDAVALGMHIIGDMSKRESFSGCVLRISQHDRTVATVPL